MRTIRLIVGNAIERLRELPDNSIESVVCDPPYGLGDEPPIEDVLKAWLAGEEYTGELLRKGSKYCAASIAGSVIADPNGSDATTDEEFAPIRVALDRARPIMFRAIEFNDKAAARKEKVNDEYHFREVEDPLVLKVVSVLTEAFRDGNFRLRKREGFTACVGTCSCRPEGAHARGRVLVRICNDTFAQSDASPAIMAFARTELGAMLTFDSRRGAVDLFFTDRAVVECSGLDLVRSEYVGTTARACGLPSVPEPCTASGVNDAADGAVAFNLVGCSHSVFGVYTKPVGFMSKAWDAYVPGPAIWRECFRVLKPGGYLLAFFGTRTYDVGTLAIRLAGFEVRDMLEWLYGQGMPKSKRIDAAIDQAIDPAPPRGRAIPVASTARPDGTPLVGNLVEDYIPRTPEGAPWEGWGSGLAPGHEPIVMARKPMIGTYAKNVLEHGTGGINVDGCRHGSEERVRMAKVRGGESARGIYDHGLNGGTSQHGTTTEGRWPANVCHDGSPEVLATLPTSAAARKKSGAAVKMNSRGNSWGFTRPPHKQEDSGGSVARYFYCAKASRAERDAGLGGPVTSGADRAGREPESPGLDSPRAGTRADARNNHPTVKPVALMRWLCRLVTPPGGTVLDPFMGSGTTGIAAHLEGFEFVGVELEELSAVTAELRIRHVAGEIAIESEAPRDQVEARKPRPKGFFD